MGLEFNALFRRLQQAWRDDIAAALAKIGVVGSRIDGSHVAGTVTATNIASHDIVSKHTASGLTTGDVLKATGATTFAFGALTGLVTNGDTHDHSGGDGAQIDHGGLAGLADDDHMNLLNETRHDALDHTGLTGCGGAVTVAEIDGSPSVGTVTVIRVTNGKLTDDGGGTVSLNLSGDAGSPDASTVTYTPAVATDWDGDADPGDVDNALDQLAERVDDLEAAGGGSVATDAIWDAAGDLVQGTGANTAARLAIGAAFQQLRVNSGASAAEWAGGANLIAETVLGSDAASIDFSSIPASYRHLQLIIWARTTQATASPTGALRFNNDSGANYDDIWSQFISNNTHASGTSTGQTSARFSYLNGSTVTAGYVAIAIIDIPAYALTTFYKIYHARGAASTSVTGFQGVWKSTSAINQITLLPAANNFLAGSGAALYGLS